MSPSVNEFNPIRFTTNFSYAKLAPTFVNNHIGVADEVARWILDKNAVLYKDERHAPHLWIQAVKKWIGACNVYDAPVLIMTDACLYKADSIVQYVEERALPQNRFLPDDVEKRKEVLDLYHLFTGEFFEEKVTRYVCLRMLPHKKLAKALFKKGVPYKEKIKLSLFFSRIRKSLIKEYYLNANSAEEHFTVIRQVFEQVDQRLADGRKYLTGNTITLADIAFAAIGAQLILPQEYGGTVAKIKPKTAVFIKA